MEHRFTTANFDEEVLNSDIPVLVDFYADWCGPCKMMAPVVEQLSEEYDGRVKIGKCNIDEETAVAEKYRIMSIPTMKIFVKGEEKASLVGAMSKEALADQLDQAL